MRADVEGQFWSERAREKLRDRALRDADRLVGQLLEHVDPRRRSDRRGARAAETDVAFTVVSVPHPASARGCWSAIANRAGYVNIIDIAPTVLELLGIDVPGGMQGRAMERRRRGARPSPRTRSDFVHANQDSVFHDDGRSSAGIVFGVGLALALAAAGLVDRVTRSALSSRSAPRRSRLPHRDVPRRPVPFRPARRCRRVLGVCRRDRLRGGRRGVARRPRTGKYAVDALLATLGLLVVLHVVDLFSGARLELDAAFGYSATFDVRVGGVSGWAFAQLAAAAMLFAGLRAGGRG